MHLLKRLLASFARACTVISTLLLATRKEGSSPGETYMIISKSLFY